MAGTTSQPPMSALVAALAHTARDPGFDLRAVMDLEPYWEAVRRVYAPFESGLPSPTGRVYDHEIPGGQLSNLRQQAIALGLGEKFEQIEAMYAAADRILGRLVKVTPSSKVVGDLALHLVAVGADPAEFAERPSAFDIPDSVIGFLAGELGDPPGGWPEPFRTRALEGRQRRSARWISPRTTRSALATERRAALNRLLFPGPAKEFAAVRESSATCRCSTPSDYLYGLRRGEEHVVELERGVRLIVGLEAIGDVDDRGMRTVMCTLNGQLRPIQVRDRSVSVEVRPRRRPTRPPRARGGAVRGRRHRSRWRRATRWRPAQTVATIEAMKMEASITTAVAGKVQRVALGSVQQVEGGDLVLVVG